MAECLTTPAFSTVAGCVQWATLAAMLGLACAARAVAAQPGTAEVWLAPFSTYNVPGDIRDGAPDYFDLFKPGADWAVVAGHTRVFKIYGDQMLAMPDAVLKEIFSGLAQRNIALAIEINVLLQTSTCMPGVDKAKPILPEIARIKRLGGDLRYLAMNEPLAGGRGGVEPGRCHASIAAIAADVATNLKPLFGIFPKLQIGDIEPIGRSPDLPAWPAQLTAWLAAYQSAMGRKLAFIHADTVWERPWQDDLQALAALARQSQVPFGMIYTGDFTELSDAAWAQDVGRYAQEAETVLGGAPEQAVFQSWVKWPQHTLPDSSPSTFTGAVRDYLRPHSHLRIVGYGKVRLTGKDHAGIAHATLRVHESSDPVGPVDSQSIDGEVSPGAASALFALRVNIECHCPPAAVTLDFGAISYADDRNRAVFDVGQWSAQRPDLLRPRAGRITATLKTDENLLLNGPPFPVHAGSLFTMRFDWGVSVLAQQPGYMAIVFRGPNGIEIQRAERSILSTWNTVRTAETDGDGVAVVGKLNPAAATEIIYDGDTLHQPTKLVLP